MPARPVRWGILSTAAINDSLIPGLLAAKGCKLVGIASRWPDKAREAAQRWGCEPYTSYEALLRDETVEAVYLPLPNHLHAKWTIRALEAGKHVLCEKPLALSVDEVASVAEAANRCQRLVLEAFMYRHAPRWHRALELIRKGEVGDPRLVKVFLAFSTATDASFRFTPDLGGGVIWELGCYAANMARTILGQEPTAVFGFGDVRAGQATETSVTGAMRFPEGRTAPFAVSFDFHNAFAQVEVVGTDGWLALPGTGFRRETYTKLLLHRGGEIYVDRQEPRVEVFPFDDPYTKEVEHLSGAIRGEHPLAWALEDARANTAVLEAMHDSVRLGAVVSIGA